MTKFVFESFVCTARILVSGGGPHGLGYAKMLLQHGFSNVSLIEKGTQFGGVWAVRNCMFLFKLVSRPLLSAMFAWNYTAKHLASVPFP